MLGEGAGGFRGSAYSNIGSVGTRGGRRCAKDESSLVGRKCRPYNEYGPWRL